MKFYLGVHHVSQKWWDAEVPLFVSRRTLCGRRSFPEPRCSWAIDSGGFSELDMFGEWRTTPGRYIADIWRFTRMGHIDWVAPQDWMCEPFIVEKTGLTVEEHQRRTVENFQRLRFHLGKLVIPVLQGWEQDEYHACWEMYEAAGVDLESERVVGLGSVCRRQNMDVAESIVRSLSPLKLHGFGVKTVGLEKYGDALVSADSMAWSFRARRSDPLPGCVGHKNCANCLRFALWWRNELLTKPKEVAA